MKTFKFYNNHCLKYTKYLMNHYCPFDGYTINDDCTLHIKEDTPEHLKEKIKATYTHINSFIGQGLYIVYRNVRIYDLEYELQRISEQDEGGEDWILTRKQYEEERDLLLRELEENYFFNLPHSAADLTYYAKLSAWEKAWCTALLLGKDPKTVTEEEMFYFEHAETDPIYSITAGNKGELVTGHKNSIFLQQYKQIKELLELSIELEEIKVLSLKAGQYIKPYDLIKWADQKHIPVPEELKKAVMALAVDQTEELEKVTPRPGELHQISKSSPKRPRSKNQCDIDLSILAALTTCDMEGPPGEQEKKFKVTKRALEIQNLDSDNVLKQITLLARKMGYNPKAQRSKAVPKILHQFNLMGVDLNNDTFRERLTAGDRLLKKEAKATD